MKIAWEMSYEAGKAHSEYREVYFFEIDFVEIFIIFFNRFCDFCGCFMLGLTSLILVLT